MSYFSPTGSPETSGSVTTDISVSDFTITEISLPAANTEFSHTFAADTKRFWIQTHKYTPLKIRAVSGGDESRTAGVTIQSPPLALTSTLTIYMESPKTGDTVAIWTWT